MSEFQCLFRRFVAEPNPFEYRLFLANVAMPEGALVRWYLRFKLSFRDLVEMMAERGVSLAHTTIMRWITRYVPEFEKRWNRFACRAGVSWRVDETYVKIKGRWTYLYRRWTESMLTTTHFAK